MSDVKWLDDIRWNEDGLVPVITQDVDSGKILMFAWMNQEALALTVAEGHAGRDHGINYGVKAKNQVINKSWLEFFSIVMKMLFCLSWNRSVASLVIQVGRVVFIANYLMENGLPYRPC
jgi:hypothetical protein